MADSARKNVSKKAKAKDALDDEGVTRREKLTLILYLEAGLAIVAGMIALSQFLAQGHVSRPIWMTCAVLGGIAALGFLATYLMRRNEDK